MTIPAPGRSAPASPAAVPAVLPPVPEGGLSAWLAAAAAAGKGGSLTRTLNELHVALSAAEQGTVDMHRLQGYVPILSAPALLAHRDRGVRALVGCCLADVLRLFVPAAPFTGPQLRDIFDLFLALITQHLVPTAGSASAAAAGAGSSSPSAYAASALYVLESLCAVRSIAIITDLEQSEELVLAYFTGFFGMVASASTASVSTAAAPPPAGGGGASPLPRNVYGFAVDCLAFVVEELEVVPSALVALLVDKLRALPPPPAPTVSTAAKGGTKAASAGGSNAIFTAASRKRQATFAADIGVRCAERLATPMALYFSGLLLSSASPSRGAADLDEERGPPTPGRPRSHDSPLQASVDCHQAIADLYRKCPALLLNVVPLLGQELGAEHVDSRTLAVKAVGALLRSDVEGMTSSSSSGSGSTLASPPTGIAALHPHVFRAWLDRRNDKVVTVRLCWLEEALAVLASPHCAALASCPFVTSIDEGLVQKLMDPEERVRAFLVRQLRAFDVAKSPALSQALLLGVGERCRDKRPAVHTEAIHTLAKLFYLHYPHFGRTEEPDRGAALQARFAWIPGVILDCLYLDDAECLCLIERVLHEHLFPPCLEERDRFARLLYVFSRLEERQRKAFLSVLGRQASTMGTVKVLLEHMQTYRQQAGRQSASSSSTSDAVLRKITAHLAIKMPDPLRAASVLLSFAKTADAHCVRDLQVLLDPESDYPAILKVNRDLLKRTAPMDAHGVLGILGRRCMLTIVSASTLPLLLSCSAPGSPDAATYAPYAREMQVLLQEVSARFPALFKAHAESFGTLLARVQGSAGAGKGTATTSNADAVSADSQDALFEHALASLANYVCAFPDCMPRDPVVLDALVCMCAGQGTGGSGSVDRAKHAATVLAAGGEEERCERILRAEPITLHSIVAGTAISHHRPALFGRHKQRFVQHLLRGTFFRNEPTSRAIGGALDPEAEWVAFADLPEDAQIKVHGIQMLVANVLGEREGEEGEACRPLLSLLFAILSAEGEIAKQGGPTHPAITAHLRLAAGLGLVQLCARPAVQALLPPPSFHLLLWMAQDPLFEVRGAMVDAVAGALASGTRSYPPLALILMLTAHDPEAGLRRKAAHTLTKLTKAAADSVNGDRAAAGASGSRAGSGQDGRAGIPELLPRLIHALAHHPDCPPRLQDPKDVHSFQRYFAFVLDAIASPANVSLLYYLAARVKTVADAHSKDSSNMYALAELAQYCIQAKASAHQWTLETYMSAISMPKDLFAKITEAEGVRVMKEAYLPADCVPHAAGHGASHGRRGGALDYGAGVPVSVPSDAESEAANGEEDAANEAELQGTPNGARDRPRSPAPRHAKAAARAKQRPQRTSITSPPAKRKARTAESGQPAEGAEEEDASPPQRRNPGRRARAAPVRLEAPGGGEEEMEE